jgi:voltage-dependent potassium channel beta subunit
MISITLNRGTLRGVAGTHTNPSPKTPIRRSHTPKATAMASSNHSMIYRNLGNTGLKVSVLSFGSWVSFDYQLDVDAAKDLISTAIASGINFFDCAEVYAHGKAELILGQALKELQVPRSDIVISTKLFFGDTKDPQPTARGNNRKHIIEGIRNSLTRLQLTHVDILYCHRPDPDTPIEETVRAMNWCVDQGLTFYWGTSEWSAQQITEAWTIADKLNMVGPCCEQPQYSLMHRKRVEKEYEQLYQERGLGLTTWSPLASGILTGKYTLNGDLPENSRFTLDRYKFLADKLLVEEKLSVVENLRPIAEQELGVSLAQLSLAWVVKNEKVSSVILGATSRKQLMENVGCLDVVKRLDDGMMEKIQAILDDAILE